MLTEHYFIKDKVAQGEISLTYFSLDGVIAHSRKKLVLTKVFDRNIHTLGLHEIIDKFSV